jgi:hypothetical protein
LHQGKKNTIPRILKNNDDNDRHGNDLKAVMIMMMMIKRKQCLSDWSDSDVAYFKERKPSVAYYM